MNCISLPAPGSRSSIGGAASAPRAWKPLSVSAVRVLAALSIFAAMAASLANPSVAFSASPADAHSRASHAETLTAADRAYLVSRATERSRSVWRTGSHQLRARNDAQRLNVSFDGAGIDAKADDSAWSWGLGLASVGRDYAWLSAATVSLGHAPAVSFRGDRVEYAWGGGVTEFFENRVQGVEQGYVIAQRPTGVGDLVLDIRVRGDLQADVAPDGTDVTFRDGSKAVIAYDALTVSDADGARVPARFVATKTGLRLLVADATARYPLTIDPTIAQQALITASNRDPGDWFGWSVSVSGDTAVVGAPYESSNATGVNGDQADNSSPQTGAAYVFVRSGTTWVQQAYLKPSHKGWNYHFGWSVAVSGDTIIVGAIDEPSGATGVNGDQSDTSKQMAGAAYVFARSGSTWSQQAYLKASNTEGSQQFGASVAVSGDSVIVGAPYESSKATGANGDQSDNSAFGSGAAYVFARSGSTWSQQAYLKASNTDADDEFGSSVAISGDSVIVAAPYESSNAAAVNGDQSDNSANASGAAYVFARSGSTWSQQAYLKGSNTGGGGAFFGASVAISGDAAVVGAVGEAQGSGAAYMFARGGSAWSQQAYLRSPVYYEQFGTSVAFTGNAVVVGATGGPLGGTAHVFKPDGLSWSQQEAALVGVPHQSHFAESVAVSGDLVLVGAPIESDTGAVYEFDSATSDVALAKAASVATAAPGDALTYTITATNAGPTPSASTVVTDTFDSSHLILTPDDAATLAQQGAIVIGSSIMWPDTSGTWRGLPPTQTKTFTYTLHVQGEDAFDAVETAVTNNASSATVHDPDGTNDSATATITVIRPTSAPVFDDTSGPSLVFPVGEAVTYTVDATGDPLPKIARDDAALPDGITFSNDTSGTSTFAGTASAPGQSADTMLTLSTIGGTASRRVHVRTAFGFRDASGALVADKGSTTVTFTVGVPGDFGFTALGGPAAVSWSGATPPIGLSASVAGPVGRISGTTSSTGEYAMRLSADYGGQGSAGIDVTVNVAEGPTVVSATAQSPTVVDVAFSKALDPQTIQPADFSIAGLIAPSAAVLQPDGVTVRLTTPAQTPGASYSVAVPAETISGADGTILSAEGTATFVGHSAAWTQADAATGVSVAFGRAYKIGALSVSVPTSIPEPPSGFSVDAGAVFDISSTTDFDHAEGFTVTLPYDPTGVDATATPALMHWDTALGRWVDITTGRDLAAHTVSGHADSFSDYAIMTDTGGGGAPPVNSPDSSGWSLAFLAVGLLHVVWRVRRSPNAR